MQITFSTRWVEEAKKRAGRCHPARFFYQEAISGKKINTAQYTNRYQHEALARQQARPEGCRSAACASFA
jgi:hypothetical protein